MTLKLKNPFTDDEIFTTDNGVDKLIEQYIKSLWSVTGIPEDKVAWGEYGKEILSTGAWFTLRCETYLNTKNRMTVDGGRNSFTDNINIHIYTINEDEGRHGRSPRAVKIFNWLREFFIINQGKEHKGIFEIDYVGGYVEPDSVRPDATKIKITIQVTYVGDIVDVP